MAKAYLVLENGRVFEGESFGYEGETLGEVVFSTAMTGYLESLTDKSYFGQILVSTFPLIGNYGVIPPDFESDRIHVKGYIVGRWCQTPSNFRSEGSLDAFLKAQKVPGLYGIDTRELTKIIRESGVMNGTITRDPESVDLAALRSYRVEGAVPAVSTAKEIVKLPDEKKYTVALMDYGYKENIARKLLARGCELHILPHDATAAEVKALAPDGVMLSNGPGDPADNRVEIENLREIIALGIPVFGICLGHQLTALAHGFSTEKLKYGHRGANQPVRDLTTGRVYISSQNHGYAVKTGSVSADVASLYFENVNDGTCEGLLYKNERVFTVQFHPEGCGGPQDSDFLFDKFIAMMEEGK